ncbi:phosphatase PAP2 family protein [Angustibacter peucedani]
MTTRYEPSPAAQRAGRQPWLLPLAGAVACFVAFAGLVDGVRERGDLSAFDPSVREALVQTRSAVLTQVAHLVTSLGSTLVILVIAVVVAGALSWRRRSGVPLATAAVVLGGSGALTYGLKTFVGRQRPPVADMLGAAEHDLSFPSGHTLNSAVLVALLCWLFREELARASRARRTVVLAVAVLAALAVGVSRAYLGFHWMTDVLGGWVVALGWICLLLAGRAWIRAVRAA